MGLHQHSHGRVLRGLEARKHLEMTKRDSHGSTIKMHVPEGFDDKQEAQDDNVATVVNVVYVTAPAGFTGSTAGYTTVTSNAQPTSNADAVAIAASSSQLAQNNEAAVVSSIAATVAGVSSSATTSAALLSTGSVTSIGGITTSSASVINNKSMFLNPPASAVASSTTVVAAAIAGTPLSATRNADSKIGNTDDGMTGGAKAGLAFGIIIGFALVAGLLFFCWRRRKNPNGHEELNEKRTSSIFGGKAPESERVSVAPSIRSSRTASTAPRLSLRPVTQFLPNLGENRKSAGNLLGIGGAPPMSEKPKSSWERRPVGTENPFEDKNEKQDHVVSPVANPFDEPEALVVANATRSSTNSNGSSTHSKNASLTGAESTGAKPDAATGAAGPLPAQNANNVHRVQLDFKPSMEDELELKSGQLVRMLHEYDDGWALCVRMDRSQQGVAPRTCLSKVPVKPRPQGPPNGQRGPPPPGMRGPHQGPGMVPRPLSPSGRERSGSTASERPQTSSSNGSSQSPAVARKPVPGQAL